MDFCIRGESAVEESHLAILNLIKSADTLTAKQLARQLRVCEKTARQNLKVLNTELQNHGARIQSKPGTGFHLCVTDQEVFDTWQQGLRKAQPVPNSGSGRVNFLLLQLLQSKKYQKLDDLCSILFISRTTITADMKQVKAILQTYHLRIEQRPSYGIRVEGAEFDRRNCIVYVQMQEQLATGQHPYPEDLMHPIMAAVAGADKQYSLGLSAQAYHSLVYYLAVSNQRIADDAPISFRPEIERNFQNPVNDSVSGAAAFLSIKMQQFLERTYSREEQFGLIIHIAGKRSPIFSESSSDGCDQGASLDALAHQMLDAVYISQGIDFRDKSETICALRQHLAALDVRMRYGIPIQDSTLERLKDTYCVSYTVACAACAPIREYYNRPIPDSEIQNLAILFALALEKQEQPLPRRNILVVCTSGAASAKLFIYRCQKAFGPYLGNIYECTAFDLSCFDFSGHQIDYVFTTVPLVHIQLPVPVFQVSPLLREQELQKLRSLFETEQENFILRYFRPELFWSGLPGKTKEDVLDTMCRNTSQVLTLPDEFYDSVMQRETLGQTDFGNLTAIPHPMKIMGSERFVAVAVLEKPIWWGHHNVQVVLLISMTEEADPNVERFYKLLSDFLSSESAVQNLISAPHFSKLLQALGSLDIT